MRAPPARIADHTRFDFSKTFRINHFHVPAVSPRHLARYSSSVERLTKADQACAVAAAALAHDFNNELTVILSSVSSAIATLEPGHPARPSLLDLEGAARRCAGKCGHTLAFSLRHGIRPARASLAAVLEM
jgi:hypothetical protein